MVANLMSCNNSIRIFFFHLFSLLSCEMHSRKLVTGDRRALRQRLVYRVSYTEYFICSYQPAPRIVLENRNKKKKTAEMK